MANEARVIDFTENGHCSNCGGCCTDFLPISEEEKRRIRNYIKKHNIRAHSVAPAVLVYKHDMTCPFRNDAEQKCDIYSVRPQICRSFVCNHSMTDILRTRNDFEGRYQAVSMRDVFFGDGRNREYVEFAYRQIFSEMAQKSLKQKVSGRYGT